MGNDPRYTPTTTFETFPFPDGLTPIFPRRKLQRTHFNCNRAGRKAARQLRNAWLNPSDLVSREPEVALGYPDRLLPRDVAAAVKLRERTLTKLYNDRPKWLVDAHADLDRAVSAAYGWPADISEEDALQELLDLNLARAGIASSTTNKSYVIGRSAFEKISAVEGIHLSEPMKEALKEIDTDQNHHAIVDRLKQVRR